MAKSTIKKLLSLIDPGAYNGISGSYDFNDFVRSGYYNLRNSGKIANAPYTTANDYGVLLVLNVGGYIAQIFIPGNSSVKTYKRVLVDSVWNNWSDIMGRGG